MAYKSFLLIAACITLVILFLTLPLSPELGWGWDAAVFRAGANALLHGQNPYLPENIVLFAEGSELATIPYYTYAPFFLVLVMPLALLPSELALRFWFLINICLYFASAVVISRTIGWRIRRGFLVWLMLCLFVFAPLRTLLMIGQSGVIMLFFFSIALWQMKRGKPVLAGVFLSLAFFKPHLVFVLPFLVLRRQWKMLAGFFLTNIVMAVPFIYLIDDWFSTIFFTHDANLSYGCLPFSSFFMMTKCLVEGGFIDQSLMVLFLAFLSICTMVAVLRNITPISYDFDIQLGIVVTFGLLIVDNIRVADQVLLVLPLLIVFRHVHLRLQPFLRLFWIGALILTVTFPYVGDILFITTKNQLWRLPVWYAIISFTLYLALLSMIFINSGKNPQVSRKDTEVQFQQTDFKSA